MITDDEAKEHIAKAKERAEDLSAWIENKPDELDAITEEDEDLLAFILSNAAEVNPTLLSQSKLSVVLAMSCFYAGYRKGEEVGLLKAVLK